MKYILPFLLLTAACFTLTAQPPNRYYPSIKNILNAPEDKKTSSNFDFFNNWIKKNAQFIFYKDLQTKESPNGDAALYSLSLVFRKDSVYTFGNSGIQLKIRTDASGIATPAVQIEQQYKILAYLRSFDPNAYNPADLKKKFQIALVVFNISEEQAMARFLNNFIVPDKKHAMNTLQQLKYDIKQQKKIDLQFDESADRQVLSKIATQIYEQSNMYSSDMLYDLYIQSAKPDITTQKFEQFFRPFTTTSASEAIDDVVAYNIITHFAQGDAYIQVAEKYIALFNKEKETLVPDRTALTLALKKISLQTVNSTTGKYWKINLEFYTNENDNRIFKISNVMPPDKANNLRSNTSATYPVNRISNMELKVYENYIEGDIVIEQERPMRSTVHFLQQKFSLDE